MKEFSNRSKLNFVKRERFKNLFWRQDFFEKFGHEPDENMWYSKITKPKTGKKRGFDWGLIYNLQPDFFYKCIERHKTKAVIRAKINGHYARVEIRHEFYGDFGESKLMTEGLIRLVRGNIKELLMHPAVTAFKENDQFNQQNSPF